MATIHVDTDKDGVVWMSGTAKTQADIDLASARYAYLAQRAALRFATGSLK